ADETTHAPRAGRAPAQLRRAHSPPAAYTRRTEVLLPAWPRCRRREAGQWRRRAWARPPSPCRPPHHFGVATDRTDPRDGRRWEGPAIRSPDERDGRAIDVDGQQASPVRDGRDRAGPAA